MHLAGCLDGKTDRGLAGFTLKYKPGIIGRSSNARTVRQQHNVRVHYLGSNPSLPTKKLWKVGLEAAIL